MRKRKLLFLNMIEMWLKRKYMEKEYWGRKTRLSQIKIDLVWNCIKTRH